MGALALAAVGGGLFILYILRTLPDPSLIQNRQVAQSTKIFDRTGQILLYEIHGEEKRTIIPFEQIPQSVKDATIAVEDVSFYQHKAVDWRGIARAVFVNLRRGGVTQGGSTITQQLAKKAFLSDERTLTRKARELLLAIRLEKTYTKDQILNFYLNQIPYGSNAYGVEAASQTYFNKPVQEVSIAEAALLAALPRAPSYYSPWGSHTQEMFNRTRFIINKMAELGFINEQQKKEALAYNYNFTQPFTGIKAPHFALATQEYLNNQYGEDFVQTAGLRVTTTLDWPLQQLAEKAVEEGVKRNEELYKGTNAALVAQDAATGQILAMVGSRDYFSETIDGKFNVATQGLRQPGSATKPFVYLTAFQKGFTPETMLFDLETEFDATGDPEKSYKPQNFDEEFIGPVNLRNALAQSRNVPAVKTLYLAGIDNFLKLIKKFGVTTLTERSRYGLSLVLGGGEVKLVDLVEAYSVLAQDGVRHNQATILKIEDSKGKVLEQYQDTADQVADAQLVREINEILSDADARRPLFQGSFGLTVYPNQEVALKTGTTNDYRDAWAMGYTPSLVVGVWAGNNDNAPLEKHGGSILAAVPIWNAFLAEALKDRPFESFIEPEPVSVQKPMLNGDYIARYTANNKEYPQIHDILYYIDKNNPLGPLPRFPENDSQFKNWEDPVLEWAKKNVPNFLTNYNQPVPDEALLPAGGPVTLPTGLTIAWHTPVNGSFIISNQVAIDADVAAPAGIAKIEAYFNGKIIGHYPLPLPKTYFFKTFLTVNNAELQNVLKVVVTDGAGNHNQQEVILYR